MDIVQSRHDLEVRLLKLIERLQNIEPFLVTLETEMMNREFWATIRNNEEKLKFYYFLSKSHQEMLEVLRKVATAVPPSSENSEVMKIAEMVLAVPQDKKDQLKAFLSQLLGMGGALPQTNDRPSD